MRNDGGVRNSYSYITANCAIPDLARGMYHQALDLWRVKWPRKQILVIPFHQLVAPEESVAILENLAGFTGVPSLPRLLLLRLTWA